MNDQNLDLCHEKLRDLDTKELLEIMEHNIIPYIGNNNLIDFIEGHFQIDDWDWFFDEYVKED